MFSCESGNYVFKVHGVGWYDAYIQVHDREALDTWRSWFDRRHDSGTIYDSSTLLARRRGSNGVGGLGDMIIEECDDNVPTDTSNIFGSGISRQHLLDRRPSEHTIASSSLAGTTECGAGSGKSTAEAIHRTLFLNEPLDDDITFAFEGYGDDSSPHITQHPLERVAAELRQNARSAPHHQRLAHDDTARRRGSECTLDERLYLHADLSQTLHDFKPPR